MGRYAMVGGKSKIVQDVLPFFVTDGNPPTVRGVNVVGLRRAGFTSGQRASLKRAFQILLRMGMPLQDALQAMSDLGDDHVRHLVEFIRNSKRGFPRARRIGLGIEAFEEDTA
jgi:UDP-N-acetylglucosamine acyltransferase